MSEEFVKYLLQILNVSLISDVKVYLLGNVIILAKDREDILSVFRAISEPPYVPMDKVKDLWSRKPSISTIENDKYIDIIVSDLVSLEQAYLIANLICSRLMNYMPFILEKIDVITTFRSSEDGGIFQRFQVICKISKINPEDANICKKKIIEIIEKL